MRITANTGSLGITGAAARCLLAGALCLALSSCLGDAISNVVEVQSKAATSTDGLRKERSRVDKDIAGGYPHAAGVSAIRIARTFEAGGPVEQNLAYAFAWYDLAERLYDLPAGLFDEKNTVWAGNAREKKLEIRQKIPYEQFQPVAALVDTCWDSKFRTCPGDELMR